MADAGNNLSGIGTVAAAATTITSSSANALAVGLAGTTNPLLQVDCSTASSATGIAIKSAASGAGVAMTAISPATNENLTISAKGFSMLYLNNTGGFVNMQGSCFSMNGSGIASWGYSYRGFSAATAYTFNGNADANLTASTEAMSMDINFAQVKTHSTGTITTQRDIRLRPSTHAFSAASALTNAYGVSIDGAPIAGSSATVTNGATLHLGSNAVGTTTNSYALLANANTGATNNYITSLNGSAGEVLRLRTDGQIALLATNTAAGTNGAQTINKPSGTVNFAASATSLIVTNSLCTSASMILATVRTNDGTLKSVQAVPAAGSFTLYANAAATAATSVGFLIIN